MVQPYGSEITSVLERRVSLSGTSAAVVIPHHNYSRFLEQALRSVVAQTHAAFEAIVVDDASREEEFRAAEAIVARVDDRRIRLCRLDRNVGQILAVYEGVTRTRSEFVALLDPDDRYEPDFLHVMLQAHLNPLTIGGIAACEMGLFRYGPDGRPGPVLAREATGRRSGALASGTAASEEISLLTHGFSAFIPPWTPGWHWGSTSGMMFRRDMLEALRPAALPERIRFSADAYCAQGAHMVGGTLFVDRLLSWRGVHAENTARTPMTVTQNQNRLRSDFVDQTRETRRLAIAAFFANGHHASFSSAALGELLTSHFTAPEFDDLVRSHPPIRDAMLRYAVNAD